MAPCRRQAEFLLPDDQLTFVYYNSSLLLILQDFVHSGNVIYVRQEHKELTSVSVKDMYG